MTFCDFLPLFSVLALLNVLRRSEGTRSVPVTDPKLHVAALLGGLIGCLAKKAAAMSQCVDFLLTGLRRNPCQTTCDVSLHSFRPSADLLFMIGQKRLRAFNSGVHSLNNTDSKSAITKLMASLVLSKTRHREVSCI